MQSMPGGCGMLGEAVGVVGLECTIWIGGKKISVLGL